MVWLYHWPNPVGRRGVICFCKLFLPDVIDVPGLEEGGGRRSAPSAETPPASPPVHLGSYTRALWVSQERRHLFVCPGLQYALYSILQFLIQLISGPGPFQFQPYNQISKRAEFFFAKKYSS